MRRGLWSRLTLADPWLALLAVGTAGGVLVAHHQDAALLRFTGVVGAFSLFAVLRSLLVSEREIRLVGLAIVGTTLAGTLTVLALLRGSLPESPVTAALAPLLGPFAAFPGVSGDTLDVNARFTVHQYGLAHLLLGVAIRDCTAGYRCYRRIVLETIDLDAIFSSGYSFLIEMAFYCQRAGFRLGAGEGDRSEDRDHRGQDEGPDQGSQGSPASMSLKRSLRIAIDTSSRRPPQTKPPTSANVIQAAAVIAALREPAQARPRAIRAGG